MIEVLFSVGKHIEEPSIIDDLMDIGKYSKKPEIRFAPAEPLILNDCGYNKSDVAFQSCIEDSVELYNKMKDECFELSISTIFKKQILEYLCNLTLH